MVRRVLERHPSTLPEGPPVVVDGAPVAHRGPGGRAVPHRYGLNPIALDPQGAWVYYGAMGGRTLYRVPAAALADDGLPPERLAAQVARYAGKPPCDGIAVDAAGTVYVTDVERHAVGAARPDGYRVLVRDPDRLQWPDGLFLAADGWLYVTANQLHRLPNLNRGVDASRPPYYLHRLRVSATTSGATNGGR
jgi:sugar lactone lactonase YvrE